MNAPKQAEVYVLDNDHGIPVWADITGGSVRLYRAGELCAFLDRPEWLSLVALLQPLIPEAIAAEERARLAEVAA